jgi:hypothetical protein
MMEAMKVNPDAVRAWIADSDVEALASWLASGTHHGKPGAPQAVKVGVIGLLREELSEAKQGSWAGKLMRRDEPVARCVACGLAAVGWRRDAPATARRLRRLAEDPDWEVREWAADALADVLARDFEGGLELCRVWIQAGSEASCRAVALALSSRAKDRRPEQVAPMLELIERLMPMDGSYLQKNLGPFAVGGGFVSRFPDETLALLSRLAGSDDENTRWNVAMAVTAAAARKHAECGRKILAGLEDDERKRVARAVAKARKNLSR